MLIETGGLSQVVAIEVAEKGDRVDSTYDIRKDLGDGPDSLVAERSERGVTPETPNLTRSL